jgi:type IX secretion system PorP/SprF family membrane protein
MKKISLFSFVFLFILVHGASAQDPHFSQMAFANTWINPALCGFDGQFQAGLLHRSQWRSIAEPFQTSGLSIDTRLRKSRRRYAAGPALGLQALSDRSGEPRVNLFHLQLSLAYQLKLTENSKLSAGLYGAYGQRSLASAEGRWSSQYDGNTYNASTASGESFDNLGYRYFDMGLGGVYTMSNGEGYMTRNDQRRLVIGAAAFHVNRPNASFVAKNVEQLPVRLSVFANAILGIPNTSSSFMPGVYWQRQASASSLLAGTYYRYTVRSGSRYTGFQKPLMLSGGLFYRWRDALVTKVLLEWHDYTFGLAYDVNISGLNGVSSGRGAIELCLRYTMAPSE